MTLSVAILFTVGLVVLLVIGNKVVEREAVVGGDEIDAGKGTTSGALVEVRTPGQPVGEFPEGAVLAAPEVADAVAVSCRSIPTREEGSCPPGIRPRQRPTVRR